MLGELSRDGHWYAFPLMVLLKTPLAVFILAALGLRSPAPPGLGTLLGIPFAVVMTFFSLCVQPQLGIRYVLPAIPFLILAAARGAADLRGYRRLLVPLLLLWQAGSTLWYHPHFIPYFNELIGRRVNAYRYLADSNLDWEDHGFYIEEFQRKHPEMTITIEPARGRPVPGWILVGANGLVGIFEPERFRWLREGFVPVRQVDVFPPPVLHPSRARADVAGERAPRSSRRVPFRLRPQPRRSTGDDRQGRQRDERTGDQGRQGPSDLDLVRAGGNRHPDEVPVRHLDRGRLAVHARAPGPEIGPRPDDERGRGRDDPRMQARRRVLEHLRGRRERCPVARRRLDHHRSVRGRSPVEAGVARRRRRSRR